MNLNALANELSSSRYSPPTLLLRRARKNRILGNDIAPAVVGKIAAIEVSPKAMEVTSVPCPGGSTAGLKINCAPNGRNSPAGYGVGKSASSACDESIAPSGRYNRE